MLLRNLMSVVLSIALAIPSLAQAASNSPFTDPSIPAKVQVELRTMFEEFEQDQLMPDLTQRIAVFTYQLLQANQESLQQLKTAESKATPMTVRQRSVLRFIAFQQMNAALANNDVVTANIALQAYRQPEMAVSNLQMEVAKIPVRPEWS